MKYDVTHHSKEIKDNFEELEGKEVAVAGRLMFKRVMYDYRFALYQLDAFLLSKIHTNKRKRIFRRDTSNNFPVR